MFSLPLSQSYWSRKPGQPGKRWSGRCNNIALADWPWPACRDARSPDQGQVDELLISGALEESHPQPEEVAAILAREVPDSEGGTTGEEPRQASLPDLLVTKARRTGATVTFIEDAALLESVGGVAAFLRWRG